MDNNHEISHIRPPIERVRGGDYAHKLKLSVDQTEVGDATLLYLGSPFPLYYLSNLSIDPRYRGFGHGSYLLQGFNQFLDETGKSGLLVNSINRGNPTHQIYKRNGWLGIDNHPDWYVYNLPEGLTSDQVNRAVYNVDQLFLR